MQTESQSKAVNRRDTTNLRTCKIEKGDANLVSVQGGGKMSGEM